MPDLATCYFCGTIDGPLEEHALVPESLDPDPEEQRTVVVCPSCGEKLDRALAPLVSFASDSDALATSSTDTETTETGSGDRDTGSTTIDTVGGESDIIDAGGEDTASTPDSEPPDASDATAPPGDDSGIDANRSRRDLPPESRKVLRLLRNREFPVERAEIETVATSAYELGTTECREAIDALVEAGVLTEEDGLLDR